MWKNQLKKKTVVSFKHFPNSGIHGYDVRACGQPIEWCVLAGTWSFWNMNTEQWIEHMRCVYGNWIISSTWGAVHERAQLRNATSRSFNHVFICGTPLFSVAVKCKTAVQCSLFKCSFSHSVGRTRIFDISLSFPYTFTVDTDRTQSQAGTYNNIQHFDIRTHVPLSHIIFNLAISFSISCICYGNRGKCFIRLKFISSNLNGFAIFAWWNLIYSSGCWVFIEIPPIFIRPFPSKVIHINTFATNDNRNLVKLVQK